VQGVGYRAFVVDVANSLGLSGWVRNRWDDTVEVTAEGYRPELERLLAYLRRGPRAALVSAVSQEWQPASGEFHGFHVRSTS
jgi:acylphosphatase